LCVGFTDRTSHLCPDVPDLYERTPVLFTGTSEPYGTGTFEQKTGFSLPDIGDNQ
jgi:hypothetical protein